jgi:hypothetical protein
VYKRQNYACVELWLIRGKMVGDSMFSLSDHVKQPKGLERKV